MPHPGGGLPSSSPNVPSPAKVAATGIRPWSSLGRHGATCAKLWACDGHTKEREGNGAPGEALTALTVPVRPPAACRAGRPTGCLSALLGRIARYLTSQRCVEQLVVQSLTLMTRRRPRRPRRAPFLLANVLKPRAPSLDLDPCTRPLWRLVWHPDLSSMLVRSEHMVVRTPNGAAQHRGCWDKCRTCRERAPKRQAGMGAARYFEQEASMGPFAMLICGLRHVSSWVEVHPYRRCSAC